MSNPKISARVGLKQAAAEQAPDPQQAAGQATAGQAGNRARVVRTRQRYEQVQKLKAEGMRIAAIQRELRLAPRDGAPLLPRDQRR